MVSQHSAVMTDTIVGTSRVDCPWGMLVGTCPWGRARDGLSWGTSRGDLSWGFFLELARHHTTHVGVLNKLPKCGLQKKICSSTVQTQISFDEPGLPHDPAAAAAAEAVTSQLLSNCGPTC